jgi:hypothetical protein
VNAARRERIEAVLTPALGMTEQLRLTADVWGTEARGATPLLLRARDHYLLAVTNYRLVLFVRPRFRRLPTTDDLLLAKRLDQFTVEKVRRFALLLQVRLRFSDSRLFVLEFRPWERGAAKRLLTSVTEAHAHVARNAV